MFGFLDPFPGEGGPGMGRGGPPMNPGRGGWGGQQNQGGLLGGLLGGLNADISRQNPPQMQPRPNGPGQGGLLGSLLDPSLNKDLLNIAREVAGQSLSVLDASKRVDVLGDMESMQRGPRPSNQEWNHRARRFCRRYPGHPKCQGGGLPVYDDLNVILQTFSEGISHFLPGIPRINIRDPLAAVSESLRSILHGFQLKLGDLDPAAANKIKNICRGARCKQQSQKAIQTKRLVQAKMLAFEQQYSGKDVDNTDKIQLRLDRTQQLKEALLERANLSHVVTPQNDGVFDQDLLLTEDQAVYLLNELGKGRKKREMMMPEDFDTSLDHTRTAEELADLNDRRKRSAIFFEENVVQQWDPNSPIPYVLDESLDSPDKQAVRRGVQEIQSKTCLKFQEFKSPPRQHHIAYYKVEQPTFCGLSYIGKTKDMNANPIYLSFMCDQSQGVAVHETMHALGVAHQHLRFDRDQHITVDWSNINPQMYDSFVVVDSKLYSSYGVPYDYGSIMHYQPYTAAQNIAKPTMIPKVDSQKNLGLMGQRNQMSQRDVELLNKMYCMPGCRDTNVYCGAWALKGLCTNPNNSGWLLQNCKKSCNVCR